jgi:uncharacterized membrane protein
MFLRLPGTLSRVGFLVGLLFFCASLSPSLLPRVPVVQGLQSGLLFAVGYGLGFLGLLAWRFLELGEARGRSRYLATWITLGASGVLAAYTLSRMTVWQNSIRGLMEMEPIESSYPLTVLWVAAVTAVLILLITRVLIWVGKKATERINLVLPRRISIGLGFALVGVVFISTVDGLVIKTALRMLDELFAAADLVVEDGVREPSSFGSSLIAWDDIGRNGKRFLTSGPDAAGISALTGRGAKEPVRVYAGYNTGETLEARARVALQELIRTGGFERSVLILATATGTGWLDPAAVEPVAFLHDGDLSIVSMQYSYLPSWLTLMVDPDRASRAARALFDAVFSHWTTLSPGKRPRLYLFGLSLGALGSEFSADVVSVLADPIDGAFWVGPPFASSLWQRISAARNRDSPQWRPEYRDGALVRFMTREGFGVGAGSEWGPLRIVYLQHGSDPMSFFSLDLAYSRPDWLGQARAPDISPYFQWYPLVSFVNVGFDVPMATTVPPGYGHTFTPASYIDGWIAVTEPDNWSDEDTQRLKAHFSDLEPAPL